MRHWRVASAVAGLVWLAAAAAASPLEERVDALVLDGFERPDAALARLEPLREPGDRSPATSRLFLQAAGIIEAQAGRDREAGANAERLLALSRDAPDPLAGAASNLVRALVAEAAGQFDVAAALAEAALNVYRPACPAAAALGPACDWRAAWRALHVLERRSLSLGQWVDAHAQLQAAFDLADA
ncbi:hypothetical protein, partial [Piscinibacter sp.]|uniref:hypothetical protein n=1 Tax=Piscinibacter sp. TaxID=1903157 RepID=UPI002F3E8652